MGFFRDLFLKYDPEAEMLRRVQQAEIDANQATARREKLESRKLELEIAALEEIARKK